MTASNLISGAQNPYDLRPALDAIENRVAALLEKDSRPLFILFGETHINTCDIILRQALTERLALSSPHTKGKTIAYGSEVESNMLEWLIENWFGVDIPHTAKGSINKADTAGKRFLKLAYTAYIPTNSPYARRNLWASLLHLPVSFQCNDTPRTEDDIYLDQDDKTVSALIKRLFRNHTEPSTETPIDLASPNGMLVRNHFMAERAIAHQQETGAQIYIQDCGKHHLYGNHKENLGYKGSLSQIFADQGHKTLVITNFTTGYKRSSLPSDGAKSAFQREALALTDFANHCFHGIFNREQTVIRRFHKSSGKEFSLYDQTIPDEDDEQYRQIEKEIPIWISKSAPE